MNETLIAAMRSQTPVWSNKLNDFGYVVEVWPNGTYFIAPWPRATGTSHNLSEIDLEKVFEVEE